jgi:hypothetical protein
LIKACSLRIPETIASDHLQRRDIMVEKHAKTTGLVPSGTTEIAFDNQAFKI